MLNQNIYFNQLLNPMYYTFEFESRMGVIPSSYMILPNVALLYEISSALYCPHSTYPPLSLSGVVRTLSLLIQG